jgi:transcriptional regulator with XRE-family HTH domain
MAEPEKIGRRMRAAFKGRGLTIKQVADAIGVYPQTIHDWWNDRYRPEPQRLRAYAEALGVTMADVGGEKTAQEVIAETLARIAGGEEPKAAFAAANGAPGEWSETESAGLTAGAPLLRDYLNQLAGGDWSHRTPEEQQRLVAELMAAEPADDEPASWLRGRANRSMFEGPLPLHALPDELG